MEKVNAEIFQSLEIFDPFGGAKPHLSRRGKEPPLRVNLEQAQALRPGSRGVDSIGGGR